MIRGLPYLKFMNHESVLMRRALCLTLLTGVATANAQDAPAKAAGAASKAAEVPKATEMSPAFEQPNMKSSMGDMLSGRPLAERLRIRKTDELLRPPFANKPVDSVKGLAAKIRAEELDVCNRVKAAQYLGTVDCKAYPEAQELLIKTMHEDKYELVRLAAAQSLGVMLTPASEEERILMCDPDYVPTYDCPMKKRGKYQAPWEKSKKRFVSGRDFCRGCCNEDVLNALAKTAYDINDEACCFEPSARVREAAAKSLTVCGICCREEAAQFLEPSPAQPEETAPPKEEGGEQQPPASGEEQPPAAKEEPKAPSPIDGALGFVPHPEPEGLPEHYPELPALRGYCIVGLRDMHFHRTRPDLWSIEDSRIYFFSSEEAKATFDAAPQEYSVQLCGSDPVEFIETGTGVEGKFLRLVDGRFYLFKSKENYDALRNDPQGYKRRLAEALREEVAQKNQQASNQPN